MSHALPTIWSIGGYDPSNGAGLLLDTRVNQFHGLYQIGILTCTTSQNHLQCLSVTAVSTAQLTEQLNLAAEQGPPSAIKIGLIPNAELIRLVGSWIKRWNVPKVIDPIMATSSGFEFDSQEWVEAFREALLPQATLLTPNLPECQLLLDDHPTNLKEAGARFLKLGCHAVLLKGGHGEGYAVNDFYIDQEGSFILKDKRMSGPIRGTGCFLATSITALLAKGMTLRDAVVYGKASLNEAIRDCWLSQSHRILNPKREPKTLPALIPEHDSWQPANAFPDLGLKPIGLYPVVPRTSWLRRLLPLGVRTIQLRVKDLSGVELEREIQQAIQIAGTWNCRLFVNDHWQLAIRFGAYGVHLGQEDLNEANLLEIYQSGMRLGISTHSYEELARALAIKPSYIALGPIFETTCKSMKFGPQGFGKIKEWAELSPYPIVAIGGLKSKHAKIAIEQGASGIALISDIVEATDPEQKTQTWLNLVDH